MTQTELTASGRDATAIAQSREGRNGMMRARTGQYRGMMAGVSMLFVGLGGCINIAAPDAPIVIELNINIRQEVIYRLAEDAANTIEENADIF